MLETLDFSQTQRIVFLIDLHPLFSSTSQNPNPNYISAILNSAQTLLTFPPLSTSLFSFKFFFSSLSPLISTSKLHSLLGKFSISLSFDRPQETLISLSKTLTSFSSLSNTTVISPSEASRASFSAKSIRQLVHEYTWEPPIQDLIGTVTNSPIIRSNLLLLFSPVSNSVTCLAKFLEVNDDTQIGFQEKFVQTFCSVGEVLSSKDIHCSWIDVNYEGGDDGQEKDGSFSGLGVVEKGIKSLGWGFISTDVMSLGSILVPFGQIYPNIGCSWMGFYGRENRKKSRGELSLTIEDVSKKPLECTCCEIELLDLNITRRVQRPEDISRIWGSNDLSVAYQDQELFCGRNVGKKTMKICVKGLWKNDESVNLKDSFSDYILLRGLSTRHGKDQKENGSASFFADRVLEMLQMETREFTPGKPIWQLFLTFLYRQNYWALVSVSHEDGTSLTGILKPFTVHSALLCISNGTLSSQNLINDPDGFSLSPVEVIATKHNETPQKAVDVNHSSESRDNKMKIRKKSLKLLKNFSWSSFCKVALSHTEIDLEAVYFARECINSKKLRFLECWMKQAKRSSRCFRTEPTETSSQPVNEEEMTQTVAGSEPESEHLVSSSFSIAEPSLSNSNMNGEAIYVSCSETAEAFFSSISQKIQQGLESEEIDLHAFAERLVESCIYQLNCKHGNDNLDKSASDIQLDDDGGKIADELLKLLLMEPKDLAVKYKSCDPSQDSSTNTCTSENKVREYELQILFRMEILCSKVRVGIAKSTTQKMVKQICTLLESIQYHLAGGFFGDVSLDKYVGRTIKNRYSLCLGDVVKRIYSKMDLLPFDSDEAAPGSHSNSDDGFGSQRSRINDSETGENCRESLPISAGICSKLEDGRREQALKKILISRKVPHLQRTWAPKQVKVEKSESRSKLSKRKERREARYDVVCETPMTGKKRSRTRKNSTKGKQTNYKPSTSVAKALFQDE